MSIRLRVIDIRRPAEDVREPGTVPDGRKHGRHRNSVGNLVRKVNLRCAKLVGLRHGTEDLASQVFASGRVTIIRASQLPNKFANRARGRRIVT